ncbi:MAG: amino acid racemase [Propionibacteriaceae bacterium]|nr:amino acid racemase [Propionibacteriaceae bacterium]
MSMRRLGLLGGMTYHSTVEYYKGINSAIAHVVGGHTSAPLFLDSLNFQEVRNYQVNEDWDQVGALLASHARTLEKAGAQAVMICSNLMHKVAPSVADAIDIPLIHIVDAIAAAAKRRGISSLGILGTSPVMRDAFYADRLLANQIQAVKACEADIEITDQIIFDELTKGIIADTSRVALCCVVDRLAQAGAQGVVLGCTELPLILSEQDTDIALIDSAAAHIDAAVDFILNR